MPRDSASILSLVSALSSGSPQPPPLATPPLSEDEEQEEPAFRFFDDSAESQPALLGQARMRSRSVKDAARVS
jgi:hypothetical protein